MTVRLRSQPSKLQCRQGISYEIPVTKQGTISVVAGKTRAKKLRQKVLEADRNLREADRNLLEADRNLREADECVVKTNRLVKTAELKVRCDGLVPSAQPRASKICKFETS